MHLRVSVSEDLKVVSLQRADADMLGGAMRDQFGLRIALGWSSTPAVRWSNRLQSPGR
ncbi:MAG: hypothetical protein P8P20_00395 [Acidimicrobiales bacterium]|nr:hypothetical protein [Acidimicrobiales bacterium]